RVRLEDLGKAPLPLTDEVDLDPELHRQPSLLGLEHGVAVGVEVVDAALALVRDLPQLAGLAEVVDVLGEADLVDSAPAGSLDERLDRGDLVCDLLALVAKVHVVVDDHESHDSTSARSSASVIFSSRRSPGTTATRPPLASTSEAQSDASPKSPANASRSTGAANACGVCTATSSERASVATISLPRTRLTVSARGSPGTAPSQPSESGRRTRSTTSSVTSGRAASCTSATTASSGTSARPARTDSARVDPPVTAETTLAAPMSSATRMHGSSHPGGATTTIESIQSVSSSRSRLSA